MTTPPLPEQIELHRDRMGPRDEELRVESVADAERFNYDIGFVKTLTDFAPLVRTPQSSATPHLTGLKALEEYQTHFH